METERIYLVCPACGLERPCLSVEYLINDTGGDDMLACRCYECGFAWKQVPLYVANRTEEDTSE